MKQETYNELEKIVVNGAKNDYLVFEILSGLVGGLMVFGLLTWFGNIPVLIVLATGIILFVLMYLPSDITMQAKVKARQELMDEVKKDVV